jgi:hypothetical protein
VPCEYTVLEHRLRKLEQNGTPPTTPNNQDNASLSLRYEPVRSFGSELSMESTQRRILELKLMHHFTTVTANKDFLSIHDETISDMWVSTTPILAFQFPVLLNTVLSIAALHLSKIEPRKLEMVDAHRNYFNLAISQHRTAVQNIIFENAEAVCLSTILVALPAFTLLQNIDSGAYIPPLQLFYLLAGSTPVFVEALPMLPETSKIKAVVTAEPDMLGFRKEFQREIYKQHFHQILNWRAPNEAVDPESQSAYELVLGIVACILANIEKGEHPSILRRMMNSLPSWVPSIYLRRLREKDPRALAILAHYFCLFKAVDGVWWMRGIAEREVLGIQSILPEHWQWALAWPLQKLAAFANFTLPLEQGPHVPSSQMRK